MRRSLCLAMLASLAACGSPRRQRVPAASAPTLGVDPATLTKTPSGFGIRTSRRGRATRRSPGTDAVGALHGLAPQREEIRQQPRPRRAVRVPLGAGQVIAGWDEGVAGMKVGGRRKLVISGGDGLRRGGRAAGRFPPASTLVFDVEVLGAIRSEARHSLSPSRITPQRIGIHPSLDA